MPRSGVGRSYLEGHQAVVLEVAGEIDRGHAPTPELALERIPVLERLGKAVRQVGHGAPPAGMRSTLRASAQGRQRGAVGHRTGAAPTATSAGFGKVFGKV